jgi:hypothetical protein
VSPERSQYRISFEDLAAHAKEITIQDGHHVPILIVEGSRRLAVSHIQEMPETHGERLQLMQLFGQAAAESGKFGRLEQVFFVSEGWMSVAAQENPPGIRPSQDPERKEVLIVSGMAVKGRERYLRIFEMVRDPTQRVVDLAELLPPCDQDGTIEIPLLDAFAQGFRVAFQAQAS